MGRTPETVDFHTSGSTGSPKTVRKPRAALEADAAMLAEAFGDLLAGRPVFVGTVSPRHMYGCLWMGFLPEAAGCRCHPDRVDGWESLLDALARYPSAVLVTTPSFLTELAAQRGRFPMPRNVAAVIVSGSLLRPETAAAAREMFGVFPTEIYGSTETGSVACRVQARDAAWTLFDGVTAERTPEGALAVTSLFCLDGHAVLQDGVDFETPRRFRLQGRLDRTVKILEHPVVLADIEAFFRAHPAVDDCHAVASREAVPRLRLLAVPSEYGRGVLLREGYLGLTRLLRAAAAAALPAYAVPRRMRFVRALPYTAQGKLPADAVLRRFDSRRQDPVVTAWTREENRLEAVFFCPADAVVFDGHFPGFPILPGVAQLTFVRAFVREAFGVLPDGPVRRLKFQKPVLPCTPVTLAADYDGGAGRIAFTLSLPDGPAASGTLTVTGEG